MANTAVQWHALIGCLFFGAIQDRMRDCLPLGAFVANECNANSYRPATGHYLEAHMDDRQLSGELLATLSLGGECEMEFVREHSGPSRAPVHVRLPRRSLQVMTGEARYEWTHAIPRRCFGAGCLRRVSVTFRGQGLSRGRARAPAVGCTPRARVVHPLSFNAAKAQ